MAASKDDLIFWFKKGVSQGATHMIVVCDTFDWAHFPVYVSPGEDVREVEKKYAESSGHKIMEVYKMAMGMSAQMNEHRAFHY